MSDHPPDAPQPEPDEDEEPAAYEFDPDYTPPPADRYGPPSPRSEA